MNEVVKHAAPQDEIIRVLESSLYPGAKPESIALVLSYCRVNGLDPMLKPVHIVPTSVKLPNGNYEMRDVLMPGIADYRIKAARSGEYGGKSEPEFGPDVTRTWGEETIIFPAWCRVTVKRIVQGQAREFVANERWLENYATAGRNTDAPNKMWKKRAYGQLAKCAESQALRMAFPEFSAGYTAEEMQGKTGDDFDGTTIDAEPQRSATTSTQRAPHVTEPVAKPTNGNGHPATRTREQWDVFLVKLRAALSVVRTRAEVVEIGGKSTVGDAIAHGPDWAQREISAALAEAYGRFPDEPENDPAHAAAPDADDHPDGGPRIAGERLVGAG